MGWLWASPSPPKPSTPVQNQPASPSPSTTQASSSTPAASTAPNEPIDPEIQKFFDLLKADTSPPPKPDPSTETQPSSSSDSSSSSWFSLRSSPNANLNNTPAPDAPPRDVLSETLLPSDMSCRQAFDQAWACNSLGGQFNAVYREGTMRACGDHWEDFWFCMRTKSFVGETRARAIRQHYRNKEHRKYGSGMPSSEDVWEARERRVEPGTAFAQAVEIAAVDDDEWRRLESERRRGIREGLGFDKASN